MEASMGSSWGFLRAVLAIVQWWGFNVTVIVTNKWIFQKLDFKFPLTVSCIHFICSAIGAHLAINVLRVKPLIEVVAEDRWKRIFPMSFVFCVNIVLGNVSLRYIPVSFMQTIKSFTPATTVVLQWLVWRKRFEWRIWASLFPIVGGILLASLTELSFNVLGFCAALFGCLATSTKTILAESLLHGYKFDSYLTGSASTLFCLAKSISVKTLMDQVTTCFSPIKLLIIQILGINTVYYMAPFATMILIAPSILLEGTGILSWFYTHESIGSTLIIIVVSGLLAFCLNFSIFYVIHSTNAVTFNVAGNLKVAVAILVSWLIFRNPISAVNALGCAVTLLGCTFYGYVRHRLAFEAQNEQPQKPSTPRTPRTPKSRVELLPLISSKEGKP